MESTSAQDGSAPAKRQKSDVSISEKKTAPEPTSTEDASAKRQKLEKISAPEAEEDAPAKRQKADDDKKTAPSAIAERLEAKKKVSSAPPPPEAAWFYKSDLRKGGAKGEAWDAYSAADSANIEKAYQEFIKSKKKKNQAKLNDKYHVDFQDMTQFQTKDTTKQRPIKRQETKSA